MGILVFLLDTVFFVLVCAALLRAWLNGRRISMYEQPGPFIMALTNWLVMPMRRTMPVAWQRSRWDAASLLAAAVLGLLHAGLLLAVWGQMGGQASMLSAWFVATWGGLAVQLLLRSAVQGLLMLVLLHAVLSWVQPHAPVQQWLGRLLSPLLRPIQRVVPLVGGIDLSPLVLLILLQVALMLLG